MGEQMNHRVTRWPRGARYGEVVAGGHGQGHGLEYLNYPRDVVVDSDGCIYVSEEGGHRVTCFGPGASRGEVVAGGRGEGDAEDQLSSPFGIFLRDSSEEFGSVE